MSKTIDPLTMTDRQTEPSLGTGRAIPIERVVSLHPFTVERRIAFRDCDPAGIVYTPRFLDPIATSAADLFMMELIGPMGARDDGLESLGTPAKALDIVFHHPVELGKTISMTVACKSITDRTFTLAIEGADSNRRSLFSMALTLICVERGSFAPIRVPDLLRGKLKPHNTGAC